MELENQLVKLTSAGVSSVPLRFRYSKAKSGVSQADFPQSAERESARINVVGLVL
jgi:hypothetical protein